ncbi:ATP-binding protein [Shewanella sp. TC10]|uniref:ATP-binding protein n=1 Tax=Shewanella sp. TC10 TaxID=1419739 RepID=UPI00129EE966|nr:ATP-binding protein [Shewanella sp. TC10]
MDLKQGKLAIIMRGLPGSGKSHWVDTYLKQQGVENAVHIKQYGYFSTDSFFENNGKYQFNPKLLGQYHQANLTAFINAMANSEPTVICDNTNVAKWEYMAYEAAAKALGYQVRVVLIGNPKDSQHQELCGKRNRHQVPLNHIKTMARLFEIDE